MKSQTLWFLTGSLLFSTAFGISNNATCKCLPSDSCWPSPTTWASLNETVTGRVLPTTLPRSICSEGGPASNTYVVNATDATHVQAALRYANQHNLKINVNNTGHSGDDTFRGSSCGALFIQTHYLKGLQFHDSYNPRSCRTNSSHSHMAATLGAGAQDDEVFQGLAKYNAVTVGGTYKTVGIVGWATSGGHGWLTSEYGQGADNILEVEMVLANGDLIVANECQNKDIFWAIRGGGGGTFGVITTITMKAYPMPQTTQWLWGVSQSNGTSAKTWWKGVAELHSSLVAVNDQGFQGYYTIIKGTGGLVEMGGYFLAYNKSADDIAQILEPFLTQANSTDGVQFTRSIVTRHDTWIEAYDGLPEQPSSGSGGGPGGVISVTRLLTKKGLTEDTDASAKMFEAIGPQDNDMSIGLSSHIIAGAFIASSKPVNNALNPAWRDTAVHLIVKTAWDTNLTQARVDELHNDATNRTGAAMRQISPDSGCYVNECDQYEPNWQWAMYGPNYSRLRDIKSIYDPDDVFWCRKCIGSEDWEYTPNTGSLCRRSTEETWSNYAY